MGSCEARSQGVRRSRARSRPGVFAVMACVLFGGWLALASARSSGIAPASAAFATRPVADSRLTTDNQPVSRSATSRPATRPARVLETARLGGEPDSIVQVANLIYAGTKSSKCFSDHFLVQAERESVISTSRRFHAVKLDSDELFAFPLVIMTGEGRFELGESERRNLRTFVLNGGFLLASAGCSSQEWDRSFRNELARVFPEYAVEVIGMEHPVFHTVYEITALTVQHGSPRPLEGIMVHGRLGVLYSQEGLNDTAHTQGCCCCGGNEITNATEISVNILGYALVH